MASSSHRIGSVAVELRLREPEPAQAVIERVSALRASGLEPLLERVFAELSPPGRHHRLDALELDLGPLPLAGFDQAFLERLEPALRQALERQLRGLPPDPPERQPLELLRLFARTGALPWWAERADRDLIGARIRQVLTLAPQAWWSLARELEGHPAALERLAAACDPTTVEALLEDLERPVASPRPGSSPTASPRSGPAGSGPPAGAFPGEGAAPLAPVPKGPPREGPDVDESPQATGSSLLEAFRTLVQAKGARKAGARLLRLGGRGLVGEALAEALLQDAVPREPRTSPTATETPPPAPDPERQVLAAEGPTPVAESDRPADRPSERLHPGDSPATPPPLGLWERGDVELHPVAAHPVAPPPSDASLAAPPRPVDSPPPPAPLPNAPLPAPPTAEADPDALHLADGGLVMLWPFLPLLLARLELLEPKGQAFRDPLARAQAAALLSFLVEGDPKPPEWRLPLPKVLCGLSPLAPWLLEESLPAPMRAEGERLLEAVIGHAGLVAAAADEVWTPAALRTRLLRRPAVLTTRPGAWLLRLERRPEDGLTRRIPWGWSWVRLPWMNHPLQVEE
ncbi:MAG: contractile injection system tape measure protein [Cyanobacteriota bacterium]|nr:contractile injection system tape measure protein [Cyanobacteriota bacterium]